VRLLINGRPAWTTMPIRRDYHGVRPYNEIEIDNRPPWRDKLLKTIRTHYGRAAFFHEVGPFVERLCRNPTEWLVDYNIASIRSICDALGLDTRRFVRSSSLHIDARATDRLIALVKAVGGTTYLAGGGAAGYQEDEKFASAGVELQYQNFRHPMYPQRPGHDFVPGLSCLDAVLHCGFEGTAALLTPRTRVADDPSAA
jgi:hypothetical protein